MQDGAPRYVAVDTTEELQARGIQVLSWPPYSPNLNLIKACWNQITDYIEDKWGLEENPSYDKLRRYVKEAWDALLDTFLADLMALMQARCQAVIDANGIYTKY